MDRTIAPEIKAVEKIDFVAPVVQNLSNENTFIWMKNVPNATSRVDFYFDAGTAKNNATLCHLTAGLLFSGTAKMDSTSIHNAFDALGAYMDVGASLEQSVVSFYALNDQMPKVLDLFFEVMTENCFPESELTELKADRKQKLLINLEKVGFQAQRTFQRQLFGDSPFSKLTEPNDYDLIQREEVISFFKKAYLSGLFKIVLVGDFTKSVAESIFEKFKPWLCNENVSLNPNLISQKGELYLEKSDAMQTALRVGRLLFTKNHPDFIPFSILNTIFGDYFGSRLMKNIREDKGYTYGIGSYVNELKNVGYFVIGSEVGKDVFQPTLHEIRNEMQRLQDELISEGELSLVRNYLEGQLLKSADGPYSLTDLYLNVSFHGLDMDYYNQFLKTLHQIEPKQLQVLAQKYLRWEEMVVVGVG